MRKKITINDIVNDLSELDSEYRESLAECLVKLKYLSDTPLRLTYGDVKKQNELIKVWYMPLKSNQVKEIFDYISKDMKNDFQYGRFKSIASMYRNFIEKNKRYEERKDMRKVYDENEVRDFLISKSKKMLNEIEMYNMDIEIVLVDKDNLDNSKVIAMREDSEGGNVICPYINDFKDALDWDYSFDEYLFKDLEEGMEIVYMTDETHLAVWDEIKKFYPEEIEYNKGMQKYLKYCKDNGITKEYVEKTTNQKNLVDVMQFYKDAKKKERER